MKTIEANEIIILIGAGASVEAGIPHSADMLNRLESLIQGSDSTWNRFRDLYYCVRASIYYANGIRGASIEDIRSNYNIEKLVATLDELAKKEDHPLFPFIGSWMPRLVEVTDSDFNLIRELRDKIVSILRSEWIEISDYSTASYYEGVIDFQQEYEHPLRIFSLNYDMCIEKACQSKLGKAPERGFNGRKWDWRVFEEDENNPRDIFLYKLHGSTDWERTSEGELTYSDSTAKISSTNTAMIFGTTYKLQYVDPFLFLAYQFRRWTLESKLIIVVGYGFGDEHINGILGQALNRDKRRRILYISPSGSSEEKLTYIKSQLDLNGSSEIQDDLEQLIIWQHTAGNFFRQELRLDNLLSLFPDDEEMFETI